MKRIAVLAILSGAAAPGPQEDSSPVEIHFVMWKPHQPEAWDRILEEFHRERPDIRVTVEIGPHSATEFHTLLTTKLRARDDTIDAFLIDVIWPTELAKAGYLEPLDDVLPPGERRAFFPATVEATTVDGRLVAAPFNIDAGLLYCRRDLLEKHGFEPPQTWSELVRQAEAILEAEGDPSLVGYTGQFDRYEGLVCNMLEFIAGRGGRLVTPEGRPALDDPETSAAIEFVRSKLIGGVATRAALNQREPQSRAVFLQGEAVFHRNWPETWNIANDPAQSKVAGKVGIATLPSFEGGRAVAALGGWQLAVAAHSERKEAAKAFVRYLASPAVQKRMTLWTSQTYSRMSVMDDAEVLEKFPHFRELKAVLMSATPRPRLANYHEVSDALQGELYARLSGRRRGGVWLPAVIGVAVLAVLVLVVSRRRA